MNGIDYDQKYITETYGTATIKEMKEANKVPSKFKYWVIRMIQGRVMVLFTDNPETSSEVNRAKAKYYWPLDNPQDVHYFKGG